MGRLTLILLLCPGNAWAAAAGAQTSLLPTGLRVVAALALVLGLILCAYALVRRGALRLPGGKQGEMRIVEMRSLGGKKGVCLLRVRGEDYLLGFGSDRVELLAQLPPRESFEEKLEERMEKP